MMQAMERSRDTMRCLEDLEDLTGARVVVVLELDGLGRLGPASEDLRLLGVAATVDWLREKGARVALAVQAEAAPALGSPGAMAPLLASALGVKIEPMGDPRPDATVVALERTAPDQVVLFDLGGASSSVLSAREFLAPFTHLVNESFGRIHRDEPHLAGAARLLAPERVAVGRGFQVDADAMACLMNRGDRPFVTVVAGRCLSDKVAAAERLVDRSDAVVAGGDVALAVLVAAGHPLGRECLDESCLMSARRLVDLAEAEKTRLVLPLDLVPADGGEPVPVTGVAPGTRVGSWGPATVEAAVQAIRSARTAFWYGAMAPSDGSGDVTADRAVAEALGEIEGYSMVAGLDTLETLAGTDLSDRISHQALGGQAALSYVAGDQLPGLEAFEKRG